jgi:YggT family protein
VIYLYAAIRVYQILLIIRILSSWFLRGEPRNEMMQMLYQITDPYLDLFRKALPFLNVGTIDFSPIAGYFLLEIILDFLGRSLGLY